MNDYELIGQTLDELLTEIQALMVIDELLEAQMCREAEDVEYDALQYAQELTEQLDRIFDATR